jgi:hypothetical protein
MKTKNILIIAAVTVAASFLMTSCNKYEEGPSFSLLSANKRIEGTWLMTETRINDTVIDLNDLTSMLGNIDTDSLSDTGIDFSQVSVTSVKATFEKDGPGNFTITLSVMGLAYPYTQAFTWAFDDKKENVNLTISGDVQTFEIVRLTNKELWIRNTVSEGSITTITEMEFEKEKD